MTDKKEILVVDDEAEIRRIIKEVLQVLGYTCQCAADGVKALELIRKECFDIVLCDIRMPGMDGLQVMAEARKIWADMPFIIITGFVEEYFYDQVIEAGANDFIRKPFTASEIKIKIDRILKERRLALETKSLIEEQVRLNEKLSTVLSVARDLTSEVDFDRLFPLIIQKMTGVMGAERTSLYIIDWGLEEVWTKVAEKVDEIRLPLGHGISGRVAETGEVINVDDAWELPYFDRSFDIKNNFRTRSVLCVPITNRSGDRTGVIQVINKADEGHFDNDDADLLMALASSAGIALENSFLMDEQVRLNEKLSTVLSVARDLTSEVDFDRLFPLIIQKVTGVMGAERTSLYIIDWGLEEVWTKVAEKVDEIRLPLGHGISGRVAETGEVINVDDAWELPYFDRSFDIKNNFRTRSVLCVPITNRSGDRTGVIQVINKADEGHFDNDDADLLMALASSAGIALENSFLMEELEASFEGAIRTLAATVDAKHPLTAGHSQRVTEYALLIAREMNFDEDEQVVIKYAGLLHDIGKIGIKDSVLLKDGPFTPEERAEMNDHPAKTRTILEEFHFPKRLRQVPEVAAYHHEKINGEGYPHCLSGDKLPMGSKILAVADVFDALTSRRDYPKYTDGEMMGLEGMPLQKVIGILEADAGSHFDPEVVAAFLRCLPKALRFYRGTHFLPEYVDETIRSFELKNKGGAGQ